MDVCPDGRPVKLHLITGGRGFIGSHLAAAVAAAGHRVRILDDLSGGRPARLPAGAEFVEADAADPAAVARALAGVEVCFHLAACAAVDPGDPLDAHRRTLGSTVAVLGAARERRVPVVYASSAAVYGRQRIFPTPEGVRPAPTSAYGADKLACEHHAAAAGTSHGVPTLGLRFFNVYGPGQGERAAYPGVITAFADRLRRGDPVALHGDGRQRRDFLHVRDAVRFLLAARDAASPSAPVFNACTGVGTTVANLAGLMADLLGTAARFEETPSRPGDIIASVGCPAAATRTLGVTAGVGLRDGLADLLVRGRRPS